MSEKREFTVRVQTADFGWEEYPKAVDFNIDADGVLTIHDKNGVLAIHAAGHFKAVKREEA